MYRAHFGRSTIISLYGEFGVAVEAFSDVSECS